MAEQVTLAAALAVVEAARKKAEKIGVPMNIAVRWWMPGPTWSRSSAWTGRGWAASRSPATRRTPPARSTCRPRDLAKISQPGDPAYGIAASTDHRIAIFHGGIPLMAGKVVVGVSGGTPDQDQQVAEAGAGAFTPAA